MPLPNYSVPKNNKIAAPPGMKPSSISSLMKRADERPTPKNLDRNTEEEGGAGFDDSIISTMSEDPLSGPKTELRKVPKLGKSGESGSRFKKDISSFLSDSEDEILKEEERGKPSDAITITDSPARPRRTANSQMQRGGHATKKTVGLNLNSNSAVNKPFKPPTMVGRHAEPKGAGGVKTGGPNGKPKGRLAGANIDKADLSDDELSVSFQRSRPTLSIQKYGSRSSQISGSQDSPPNRRPHKEPPSKSGTKGQSGLDLSRFSSIQKTLADIDAARAQRESPPNKSPPQEKKNSRKKEIAVSAKSFVNPTTKYSSLSDVREYGESETSQESIPKSSLPESFERKASLQAKPKNREESKPSPKKKRRQDKVKRSNYLEKSRSEEGAPRPKGLPGPTFDNPLAKWGAYKPKKDLSLSPGSKRKFDESDDNHSLSSLDDISSPPSCLSSGDSSKRSKRENASDPREYEKCPLCDSTLDLMFQRQLKDLGVGASVQQRMDFCKDHRRAENLKAANAAKYPAENIDWLSVRRRAKLLLPQIEKIIIGDVPGKFYNASVEDAKLAKGKMNNLISQNFEKYTPGYYGPKGAAILGEVISENLQRTLRARSKVDQLISKNGVGAFVQNVLVPEMGLRLIMEDMKISEEEAVKVMADTIIIGEVLNHGDDDDEYEEEDSGWISV